MPNGQIRNRSSKTLWVVESDTGPSAKAHKLAPGRQSLANLDADGVKAQDGTPIDDHPTWWKVTDLSTADVTDATGGGLSINCILCFRVEESEFGTVTFDPADGWGEPIQRG